VTAAATVAVGRVAMAAAVAAVVTVGRVVRAATIPDSAGDPLRLSLGREAI